MPTITFDFSVLPSQNLEKLREAIVYIAQKSESDPKFGAIKLNKILYYADFASYRQTRQSITGATYQRLSEGPAPKELLRAKEELEDIGAIKEESRPYFNRLQKRLSATRPANLEVFDPAEVSILDGVIDELWNLNGRQVSDLSHTEWGWLLTETGEVIPYESAWLSPEPLTQEQIAKGIALWQQRQSASA